MKRRLRRAWYRFDDWVVLGNGCIAVIIVICLGTVSAFYALGWYLRSLGVPGIDIYLGYLAIGQIAAFLAARKQRGPSSVPDAFKRPPGSGRARYGTEFIRKETR